MLPDRPISATECQMVRLMMPTDANPHGNVHGGVVMKYVDELAGIVAHRHARRNVVTARMHRMDFLEPVFIGNALILTGRLVYCGRTSMDVVVDIEAENLDTGEIVRTGTCWLTMIALNERLRPVPVPKVYPETEEEKALYQEAERRREERKHEEQSALGGGNGKGRRKAA